MAKKKTTSQEMADAAGWGIGLAGILVFLFGIMLFLNPAGTVEGTVFLLGIVLLVSGALKLAEGLIVSKKSAMAGFYITSGLVAVIIGLIMALMPGAVAGGVLLTFGILALLLAFLAIVGGVWQIKYALGHKKRAIPMLIGALYLLFGLFMLFNPIIATLALVSVIGVFTMFYGLLLIVVAGYAREVLA